MSQKLFAQSMISFCDAQIVQWESITKRSAERLEAAKSREALSERLQAEAGVEGSLDFAVLLTFKVDHGAQGPAPPATEAAGKPLLIPTLPPSNHEIQLI